MSEQSQVNIAGTEGIKTTAPRRQRRRCSLEQKRQWVEQWNRSGKSRAQFCREHHLGYISFLGWSRDLAAGAGGFVEVKVEPDRQPHPGEPKFDLVEIISPTGWRMRLSREFDSQAVASLLSLLSQC